MKVIYPICCGVDAHKTFLIGTIYRLKYEQISKRRVKKGAIIAIARMILAAIFQMMTAGEVWNPPDLFKADMPESLKERQLSQALRKLLNFLKSKG